MPLAEPLEFSTRLTRGDLIWYFVRHYVLDFHEAAAPGEAVKA